MNGGDFYLFPPSAARLAGEVDRLIFTVFGVSLFFALLIAAFVIYFAIRYRRSVRPHPPEKTRTFLSLEIVWSVVPLVVVLILFGWGARLFVELYAAGPKDAYEVYAIGKQWMWMFQHPQGRREINELHLPVGTPVRVILVSQDVIHDLFIPAFRIKHDVLPMRYTAIAFEPTRVGQFHLFCAEYCGTKHSEMVGRIVTMEPSRFQDWLGTGAGESSPVDQGAALLESLGCRSCHAPGAMQAAPMLEGLFGGTVRLADGSILVAEENYVRESILNPKARVVLNFQPVMPSYQGRISEEELLQIIAYLKSVGSQP